MGQLVQPCGAMWLPSQDTTSTTGVWMVALNQVRHRSYWGSVGNGGVMTPGVEWWDRWWERISMSPGQGEMNDGETPSPNGVRDVANSMPWSLEDPFAGDTGAAAGAPCPKQAPRNGQTVEVLGGERPTRLPEPAGAGLGARRGGRKFDAPPAAPPTTTMTDAVAPMDDGMEHGDQDHKHLAYTIPGSQESLQYAYARVNGIVAVEGRPWHGVGDAIGSSGPRPHAENGTENNRQQRKSAIRVLVPLCLAQRATRLCCIGVGLRAGRIKCQSTPFLYQ